MKTKLTVLTILGTRPEIIRLSEVIKKCDQFFNHILVHTGQNWDYTLNEVFFKDLELRQPDHYLDCVGNHLGETIGNIIAKSFKLLQELKPDALLILGDTNSALCAIAAKRLKIPIFHMEAGNRCFDQNVPEEINRRIVDHISDVNLCYTEHSRRHLLNEGLKTDFVFVSHSPMTEVIQKNLAKIKTNKILETQQLKPGSYFLLSLHREENVDTPQKLKIILDAVASAAQNFGKSVLVSTHPRTKNRLAELNWQAPSSMRFVEPFGFLDYLKLQTEAFCVLSDSGTLSEESTLLSFPGVLLRDSTERPEVLDEGSTTIGGVTLESLLPAIDCAIRIHSTCKKDLLKPPTYESESVSTKVVNLIASYHHIVKTKLWGLSLKQASQ